MSSPGGWPPHQNNNNFKTNQEDRKSQTEHDVITTTTSTDMSLTCTSAPASTHSDMSQSSHATGEPTIVEEYMVSVPLVRPKPTFLKLLHKIGAHGEIFTMKELCYYLKEYIKSKLLYDQNDPSIVYCQNDELGAVFQVDTFTINDVIDLLKTHCTYVPDTCLKRKRRILSPASQHAHQQRLYAAQNSQVNVSYVGAVSSRRSLTVGSSSPRILQNESSTSPRFPVSTSMKNTPTPIISSTSPPESPAAGSRSKAAPVSTITSGICLDFNISPVSPQRLATGYINTPVSGQVSKTSTVTSAISQGSVHTQVLRPSSAAHVNFLRIAPDDSTQPQCSKSIPDEDTQPQCAQPHCSTSYASSEVAHPNNVERSGHLSARKNAERMRISRGRKHLRSKSSSESSDTVSGQAKRPRQSRTSVSEGVPAGTEEYPWYFRVNVEASDESEVLSIQSKETALGRKDSSDDLWFLQEEQGPSDTFSVEYEVPSEDDSPGIRASFCDSDEVSDTSQENLVVICHDSDMDFWADADSSTDSDSELTVADNWSCDECDNVNPPLQRYCSRCWKLRLSWLPDKHQAATRLENKSVPHYKFTADAAGTSDQHKKPSSSLSSSPSSATSQPMFASSPKSHKSSSSSSHGIHFSHHMPSISLSQEAAAESQEEKENTNILSYDNALQYDSGLGAFSLSSSQGSQGSHLSQRSASRHNISVSSPSTASSLTCVQSAINTPGVRTSSTIVPEMSSHLADKKYSSPHKLEPKILESRTTLSNFQVKAGPCRGYDEVDGDTGKAGTESRGDEDEAGPSGVTVTPPVSKRKSSQSNDQFKVLCMICMSKPKNACLIHGKTSHQVCCYSCAKILKKRGKGCPVCRRPIWHVTKNYMV